MSRRKDPSKGNPRTGDGDTPRGRKPKKSELWMVRKDSLETNHQPLRKQPRGWGLGKVIDIFTGRERG